MRTLVIVAALLVMVPGLRAQQTQAKEAETTTQEPAENPPPNSSADTVKPGHPLDQSDVDILTGKKDREVEAARRSLPYGVLGYGGHVGAYGRNGVRDEMLDVPVLPLTRIQNSFFFYNVRPRSFNRISRRGRAR